MTTMDKQLTAGEAAAATAGTAAAQEAQGWWPVALSTDVTTQPSAATLLGQDGVLVMPSTRQARAGVTVVRYARRRRLA